jgi:hypothetical protein
MKVTRHVDCAACGYDLYGLDRDSCPECGKEFDAAALLEGALPLTTKRKVLITIAVLSYAVAALPSGMLLGIYLSFALASFHLGRIPSYGNPDPRTLPNWVMGSSSLMCPGMALVPAVTALVAWCLRRSLPGMMWIAPVVLAVLAWTLLWADPLGALNWWAD